MKKIKLYINNKKIDINEEQILFDKDKNTINILDNEYTVLLNFKTKECIITLNANNASFNIDVINMEYKNLNNVFEFKYTLESEPDIVNIITINN